MNDLVAIEKIAQWEKLKMLVLDSVSSPITKRVYNMALNEFMAWFQQAPRPGFTKATVSAWRVSLEERRLGSSSIIIRMSAIRKLAAEAADNGLLAPELAQGISRVKSVKSTGIRVGNWLSQRQAQALLSAPDISTVVGLRDRAIHQAYPKTKYHWTKEPITVKDSAGEGALGGGWADTPAAFDPYRGPRKPKTQQQDATKWVDQWSNPGLAWELKRKITAQLLRADAGFWRSPDTPLADMSAMRQAFDGVAKVLSEGGVLTESVLRNDLPRLIWDSAIAGGWYRFASEERENIFPEQLGHYSVWRDESTDWKGLFYSEATEWLAWILENPAPLQKSPGTLRRRDAKSDGSDSEVAERAARRQAVVMPILEKKQWKPGRLVTEAGVGKNSVYDYLDGTRAKITDKNREAIAQALDLMPDKLPD